MFEYPLKKIMKASRYFLSFSLAAAMSVATSVHAEEASVDFNRQIRPILAANCFTCHGPDAEERKAKLRLDRREDALAWKRGKRHAIVAGDPAKSSVIRRISAEDPDDRMPPPESGKKLTAEEISLLSKWIEQGAKWEEHWAYKLPVRRPAPEVKAKKWARGAVDRFILSRLEREGMQPAGGADRVTLLRRLTFDLTGLPPSPAEIDAFLNDKKDGAYERLLDRLLQSPHYGERMAVFWLDLVRFADTRGYHSDNPRAVSPYRDYVIKSFNENLPYDRFTVEQLAGDLLPEASRWQRVASAYNKLIQTTEEGGAQPKEYEAKNASDRVRNVSVVWMGATLGCAQCHAHKFDPYGADDFYTMAAFFADIQESPIGDRDGGIPVPSLEQESGVAEIEKKIAAAKKQLENPPAEVLARVADSQRKWEAEQDKRVPPELGAWHLIGPFQAGSAQEAFDKSFLPEDKVALSEKHSDAKLEWKERKDLADGKVHPFDSTIGAWYLYRTVVASTEMSLPLSLGSDDGVRVWINGKIVHSNNAQRGVQPDQDKVTVRLQKGANTLLMKIVNTGGGSGFYFRHQADNKLPPDVVKALNVERDKRSEAQKATIHKYYVTIAPQLVAARAEVTALEKQKQDLEKSFSRCIVSRTGNPRTVRVLPRGNWLDDSGKVVQPAIPAYFGKLDTGDERPTRLDLAKWFISKDNPLTARVFVNRLWKLYFGKGISSRLDDLGAMGEPLTHPELLDWLAVEFVESGWNVQHMIRLLVTSAAYRQSSVPNTAYADKDPYNRLLSAQSRWRFDAETVRDNALALSGLLSRKIGGPSVKPYQPAGYWMHLNFPKRRWSADKGENGYRRGMYTWWQRSFLHPSLMAFDAPNREECTAERPVSNIPQQALVLLNDPTYVEAARVFAARCVKEGGDSVEKRIAWAFRLATSRRADAEEIEILADLYAKHLAEYGAEAAEAAELLKVGVAPAPPGAPSPEIAAWTSVCRTILNLHETITRN